MAYLDAIDNTIADRSEFGEELTDLGLEHEVGERQLGPRASGRPEFYFAYYSRRRIKNRLSVRHADRLDSAKVHRLHQPQKCGATGRYVAERLGETGPADGIPCW